MTTASSFRPDRPGSWKTRKDHAKELESARTTSPQDDHRSASTQRVRKCCKHSSDIMPLAARRTRHELQASFHLRQDKTHLELDQIRASPTTSFLLQVGLDSNYTATRPHDSMQSRRKQCRCSRSLRLFFMFGLIRDVSGPIIRL